VAEAHQAKAEALAQEVLALKAQLLSANTRSTSSSGGGDVAAAAAAEAEAKRKAAALEAGNKKLIERVTSLVRTHTDRVGSFK
jgi:cell division septum initiation protein DivIVA